MRPRVSLAIGAALLGAAAAYAFDPSLGRQRRHRMVDRLCRAEVDDQVLTERVRAKLARYVSHRRTITVSADRGIVRLAGDILAREYPGALRAASAVAGVKAIEVRLRLHRAANA